MKTTILKTVAAVCLLSTMMPAHAAPVLGVISTNPNGGVTVTDKACTDTAAYQLATSCVGQVSGPVNNIGGAPTLVDNFLNQEEWTTNGAPGSRVTYTGFVGVDASTPWGVVGDWLDGGTVDPLPGADGFLTATGAAGSKSGGWTFDLGSTLIDYLVVVSKASDGWSAYFYDLTALDVTSFSDDWDTLGLLNNGGQTPGISHLSAAYIPGNGGSSSSSSGGVPSSGTGVPEPGTASLLGIAMLGGLLGWRHRRVAA